MDFELGDRVLAVAGNGGYLRPGVVTMIATGSFLNPFRQYHVHFDGDEGHSGPCWYVEPEPSARETTAA